MKNIFLTCLLFVCFSLSSAFAQENAARNELSLHMRVTDAFTRDYIAPERVKITVYGEDSTEVLTRKTYITYRGSNFGRYTYFIAKVPKRSVYVVLFEAEGYDSRTERIKIPERWLKKITSWDTKAYTLRRSYVNEVTEEERGTELEEATVVASRVKMVMRGDTLVYDARAFQLADGSMLDNLIRALPGAKLDENGVITVNGKRVSELLVNGRDFFKGNPNVALDNLPAYTVNQIKVFHRKNEFAYLRNDTTKADDNDPYVMDVRLKREYSQGWIANAEVAGGSKTRNEFDPVWLARLFAMRYTDHSGLALYGSINNLGDNQSPGRKGEWKKMDVTRGERTVKTGGATFDLDGKYSKVNFNTTLEGRHETTNQATRTDDIRYYPSGNLLSRSQSKAHSSTTRLDWNAAIKKFAPNIAYSANVGANYLRRRGSSTNFRENQAADTLQYTRDLRNKAEEDTWKTKMAFFISGQNPWWLRKTFSFSLDAYYTHTAENILSADHIYYSPLSQLSETRRDRTPHSEYSYSMRLSHLLVEKQRPGFYFSWELTGGLWQHYHSGRRDRALREDEETHSLPSADNVLQWNIDEQNSFRTSVWTREGHVYTYIHLSDNEKGNLSVRFQPRVAFDRRSIHDFRAQLPAQLVKHDIKFSTWLYIKLTKELGVRYSYDENLPDMLHLLGVRDASDPLSLQLGNHHLKRMSHHDVSISWDKWKKTESHSYSLRWTANPRAIGMARTYDSQTGITTNQPLNINGNWDVNANGNYSCHLDKKQRLHFSTDARIGYMHSVDFSADNFQTNPVRSLVHNWHYAHGINLKYSIKRLQLAFKGNVSYTRQTSDHAGFVNGNYTDFQYGLSLSTPLVWGIDLETDLMAYARRGYNDPSMNTTDWVWNASLSRALGKKKLWLVRAVGFDLLHQLSSVKRYVTAQGTTETWYNTVPAYATLHLIYRLQIKPKKERK